jgi:hypothetical protein
LRRDGADKPDPNCPGQIPGLRPDYILRVTVLENHLVYLVLVAQRKYVVRADLVSCTTGAVAQSAVGTGEYAEFLGLPAIDPYPKAVARAVTNAITHMTESH